MTVTASPPVIDTDQLELIFEVCLNDLAALPAPAIVRCVSRWTAKLASVEAAAMAESVTADGDSSAARDLLRSDRKTSRREKNKKTKRAKAAAKNPDLVDKMRAGEFSGK